MHERVVCYEDCFEAKTHSGDIRKGSYIELYRMEDVDQSTIKSDTVKYERQRSDFRDYLEAAADQWEQDHGRPVTQIILAGSFESKKEMRKGWIFRKGVDLLRAIEFRKDDYDIKISIDDGEEMIVRAINNRLHLLGVFRIYFLGAEEKLNVGRPESHTDGVWFSNIQKKYRPLRSDDALGFYRGIGMYW